VLEFPPRVRAFALATLVLAACGPSPSAPDALPDVPNGPVASLFPFDVLGVGVHVPPGGHPCTAAPYRDFDFWVGNWDVRNPAGTLVGTNVVSSRLGGCVVEESWTSAFLGSGRSLNAYDASTGTWSQFWVGSGGCPFSVILIEGGFANGSMTMVGTREQPEGFLNPPQCGPSLVVVQHTDLIRWTALTTGIVLQQFASANDGPLTPPPAPELGQGLRYQAVAEITPLNPPSPSFCPSRAAAKQFDFMIGTWDIHQGNGNGAQGRATFTKDQQDCLVEERVSGLGGYEGWSFNTFDVFTQQWVRTYVDNAGRRLHLTGALENGVMTLTAPKNGAAGPVTVRVSWVPVTGDEVLQRWEFSRDGGVTWGLDRELSYTRAAD
jgi:hypothetical protein